MDTRQNALLIIRVLDDQEAYSLRSAISQEAAQAAAGLSEADALAALEHCLYRKSVQGGTAGCWLSERGRAEVKKYQRESMGLSLGAERVLELVVGQEQAAGGDITSGQAIWEALGIEQQQYKNIAQQLSDNDLLENKVKARGAEFLSVRSTPRGREAVRRDFARHDAVESPTQTAVTVHGDILGSLQVVGTANNSQISQLVNDPASLAQAVDYLTGRLAEVVREELSESDQYDAYITAMDELKTELLSQNPRGGRLKRLLGVLGLIGDIDGTIGLIAKAWPLLAILAQIMGLIPGTT